MPLVIELLSPARRPVQVTRDLPRFWRGSYAAVKAELRAATRAILGPMTRSRIAHNKSEATLERRRLRSNCSHCINATLMVTKKGRTTFRR